MKSPNGKQQLIKHLVLLGWLSTKFVDCCSLTVSGC